VFGIKVRCYGIEVGYCYAQIQIIDSEIPRLELKIRLFLGVVFSARQIALLKLGCLGGFARAVGGVAPQAKRCNTATHPPHGLGEWGWGLGGGVGGPKPPNPHPPTPMPPKCNESKLDGSVSTSQRKPLLDLHLTPIKQLVLL
jgi:hypothetical protein